MELKNITIIGASGNIGRALLPALLANKSFTLTVLLRPTSTFTAPTGVHTLTLDPLLSPPTLTAALLSTRTDVLINLLPGNLTSMAVQKPLIDAAVAAGVKVFFANEYVADVEDERFQAMPRAVVGEKGEVRAYLAGLAREGRMGWMAVNGGAFFDLWLTKGPAGFDLKNRKATLYNHGTTPLLWTLLPQLTTAMLHMLQHPTPFLNRAVFLLGVKDLTQLALLHALEEELGIKFEVEDVDTGVLKKEGMAMVERGDMGGMRGLTLDAQFGGGREGFKGREENDALGVEAVGVKVAVRVALKGSGV